MNNEWACLPEKTEKDILKKVLSIAGDIRGDWHSPTYRCQYIHKLIYMLPCMKKKGTSDD